VDSEIHAVNRRHFAEMALETAHFEDGSRRLRAGMSRGDFHDAGLAKNPNPFLL
jgi:hypothetical protein